MSETRKSDQFKNLLHQKNETPIERKSRNKKRCQKPRRQNEKSILPGRTSKPSQEGQDKGSSSLGTAQKSQEIKKSAKSNKSDAVLLDPPSDQSYDTKRAIIKKIFFQRALASKNKCQDSSTDRLQCEPDDETSRHPTGSDGKADLSNKFPDDTIKLRESSSSKTESPCEAKALELVSDNLTKNAREANQSLQNDTKKKWQFGQTSALDFQVSFKDLVPEGYTSDLPSFDCKKASFTSPRE